MKRIYTLAIAMLAITTTMAQKIAYILPNDCSYSAEEGLQMGSHSESGDIKENPEKNAAEWFLTNYVANGLGDFITIKQVNTNGVANEKDTTDVDTVKVDLTDYAVVWIHVERKDLALDHTVADYGFSDIKDELRNYVAAGGNLYLSKQATFLCYDMGRIGYAPTHSGGEYEEKSDPNDWFCTQPIMGYAFDTQTDRSDHPIFEGLVQTENSDWWHNALCLNNSFYRLNRRCSWNDFFPRTEEGDRGEWTEGNIESRLTTFESEETGWAAKVLSVQGNITDYCLPDIIEFLPAEWLITWNSDGVREWKGRVITNGSAYYEWSTRDGEVSEPVKILTANILNYLTPETPDNPDDPNNPDNPDDPNNPDNPDDPGTGTGIDSTKSDIGNGSTVISISGMNVNGNSKGLIIKDGRKYIIK